MAKKFRYRGEVYETVNGASLGELRVAERHLQTDFGKFTTIDSAMVGFYVSVRRGQIAAGRTPLVTWDEIENSTLDEFEDVSEPEPTQLPYDVEPPESEWPLDPTDAGTRTGHPGEYDQPPLLQVENAWTTPGTSFSGSSPNSSAGHLLP
jgi:hypothetical protein